MFSLIDDFYETWLVVVVWNTYFYLDHVRAWLEGLWSKAVFLFRTSDWMDFVYVRMLITTLLLSTYIKLYLSRCVKHSASSYCRRDYKIFIWQRDNTTCPLQIHLWSCLQHTSLFLLLAHIVSGLVLKIFLFACVMIAGIKSVVNVNYTVWSLVINQFDDISATRSLSARFL